MRRKGRQRFHVPARNPSRGEHRPLSKLTDAIVREVRQRYDAGGVSQRALAAELSVAYQTLGKALRRETWQHIS